MRLAKLDMLTSNASGMPYRRGFWAPARLAAARAMLDRDTSTEMDIGNGGGVPPGVPARALATAHAWLAPMLRGTSRARTLGLAAEMSFWVFLSLIPLAAVAGLIGARLASTRGGLAGSFLESVTPGVRELVERELESVARWNGGKVAPLAVAMFVWLAASGVHSIFDALEVQAGVTRPWWQKRLLAVATCAGLSVGVALLGLLAFGLDAFARVAGTAVPVTGIGATIAASVARIIAGCALSMGMIAALYRVGIPREARGRMPIVPGALLAVVLMVALGWSYRLFIAHAGAGDAYEGGLAVIGVTLMTLWLFSLALLLGVQLNRVVADQRSTRVPISITRSGGNPK